MLVDECFPKEIIFVTQQSRIQDFGSAGGLLIEEGDDILTWWGGGELQGKAKLYMRGNNLRAERANFLFVLRPHLFLYSILYSILTSGSLPSGSIVDAPQTTPRQQRGWSAEGSVKSPWSTRRKR